jgi:hypothetical protein
VSLNLEIDKKDNMKFQKVLKERQIPVTGSTPQGKKLLMYRGIKVIFLDEGEPPDVAGIPKNMDSYGRGEFDKNGKIYVDGGPSGSRQGHPSWAINGFYWGADLQKHILYIRGRASTNEETLAKSMLQIIDLIFPRLPKI